MASDNFITWIIDKKIEHLKKDFTSFQLLTRKIDLTKPDESFEIDNEVLILASESLDIPDTATITFECPGNIISFTKAEYTAMQYHKHQFFSDRLKISVANYGAEFIPFSLEFIRIIPTTN